MASALKLTPKEVEAIAALVSGFEEVSALHQVASHQANTRCEMDVLTCAILERTETAIPFIETLRDRLVPRTKRPTRKILGTSKSHFAPWVTLYTRLLELAAVADKSSTFVEVEFNRQEVRDDSCGHLSAQIEMMRSLMGEIDALKDKVLRAAAGKVTEKAA